MPTYKSMVEEYIPLIEKRLKEVAPKAYHGQQSVCDAVNYSLMNGGKRIRPILTLEFARVCGGSVFDALPYACAIEMVHCYSLIHDDLPCMDDDDVRRGKPACHIKFGESCALLAGDALLTMAFETIMKVSRTGIQKPENILKAAQILAESAGISGMIGGQVIDLESENQTVTVEQLATMDTLKTGALISAACKLGCVCAGADDQMLFAAEEYARNIGLAFQIIDDILDATSSTEELGKPVGSDVQKKKSTYVSLLGIEKSKETANRFTADAIKALAVFGDQASGLVDLAESLAGRSR